jgi:hypothetical protein
LAVIPVGGRELVETHAAFQSVITCAVLVPERFRGGCAFGAGGETAGLFREVSSPDEAELAARAGFVNDRRPSADG